MNKTRFPVGFHPLHADVSINFQMNRWLSWVAEAEMLDEMRGLAPRITNYVDWKRDFLALAESADRRGHGLMAGFYFRAADFFMRTDDPDRRHARQQFLHARRSVYGLDQLGPPRGALRRRRRTRRLAGLPFHATTMQRHDRFLWWLRVASYPRRRRDPGSADLQRRLERFSLAAVGGSRMVDFLDRNKRNAMSFYDLMFNQCQPAEAIQRFAGDVYVQHNPHVADGKQAFIDYFERMAKQHPGKRVTFKRCIAEGHHVVLHCHQAWPTDPNRDWAGIDIFRFDEGGKIVEHWDVLQVVPNESANGNTMF
jgi:predicted SnoaL-like aldol condensation-catalyzing enzyme